MKITEIILHITTLLSFIFISLKFLSPLIMIMIMLVTLSYLITIKLPVLSLLKQKLTSLELVLSSLWRGTFLVGTLLEHSFLFTLIRHISISFQIIPFHSKFIFHSKKKSFMLLRLFQRNISGFVVIIYFVWLFFWFVFSLKKTCFFLLFFFHCLLLSFFLLLLFFCFFQHIFNFFLKK